MGQEIALQSRHGKLAHHSERTELSVEITQDEKSTLVSIDHSAPGVLPDSVRRVYFAPMLAHYPVPVTTNGNPLQRIPYYNEAGIYRVQIRWRHHRHPAQQPPARSRPRPLP